MQIWARHGSESDAEVLQINEKEEIITIVKCTESVQLNRKVIKNWRCMNLPKLTHAMANERIGKAAKKQALRLTIGSKQYKLT